MGKISLAHGTFHKKSDMIFSEGRHHLLSVGDSLKLKGPEIQEQCPFQVLPGSCPGVMCVGIDAALRSSSTFGSFIHKIEIK